MKIPKKLTRILNHVYSYRVIAIWLIVLGLLGFTLWQDLKISDPGIDQQYLQSQRSNQEQNATDIELDDELRAQIDNLERIPVDTEPRDLGTQDPFNP